VSELDVPHRRRPCAGVCVWSVKRPRVHAPVSLSLCRSVCALTCLGGCTCAIGAAPSVHTVLFDSPVVAVHAFTDRAPASTLILHTFRYRGKHIHIHIHTYIHTHKQAHVTRTNEYAPPHPHDSVVLIRRSLRRGGPGHNSSVHFCACACACVHGAGWRARVSVRVPLHLSLSCHHNTH
jgi:hypothetical protein